RWEQPNTRQSIARGATRRVYHPAVDAFQERNPQQCGDGGNGGESDTRGHEIARRILRSPETQRSRSERSDAGIGRTEALSRRKRGERAPRVRRVPLTQRRRRSRAL